MRNRTSNLRIPRSDALPLSHRDPMVSDYEVHLSHACDKTEKKSFSISSPSSKFTISLISIYKHYAIDITDPSSMQDACHMNFVIDLAHHGVSVAQW